MKKIIYLLSIVSIFSSCASDGENTVQEPQVSVNLTPDQLFEDLKNIDRKLLNNDLSVDGKVAKELFESANQFASENPSHERAADALELAAKGAEGIQKYNEAINILHKIITEYPETEKTPMFMYRKAIILEENLGKPDNAKAAYQALIDRFPNDLLSVSAQEYLDMDYLNMSDAELIKFLESKNQ